jgi:hypothetical protein
MQFPEYMQKRFPGLQLGPDLFHQWTVGLRFELNVNHWPNVRWDAVLGAGDKPDNEDCRRKRKQGRALIFTQC